MGIFSKSQGGFRCESMDETGETTHCQIFETNNEGKLATGTDFAVNVSRANNCIPTFVGNRDILEKDEKKVNQLIEQKVRACKKGLVWRCQYGFGL